MIEIDGIYSISIEHKQEIHIFHRSSDLLISRIIITIIIIIIIIIKLNLWLTAPKGDTPVTQTSATDWQMAVRWDNVISITLSSLLMSTFFTTSLSRSYPLVPRGWIDLVPDNLSCNSFFLPTTMELGSVNFFMVICPYQKATWILIRFYNTVRKILFVVRNFVQLISQNIHPSAS